MTKISSPAKTHADAILASWVTLEVLSPQPLPNNQEMEAIGRTLVRLEEHPEPWNKREFHKQGGERAVHWMVYLGELDLGKAIQAILNLYPDDAMDERSDITGSTTLAVIVVDEAGRLVKDKTFLSSFAWGYGRVRAGKLKELSSFPQAESDITADLERRLIRQDEEGRIIPLGAGDIDQAIEWLVRGLNLPDEEVLRPGIAIRVPQLSAFKEAPEPELLNSFFIEDLVRVREAVQRGTVGSAASAYVGMSPPKERQDVVRAKEIIPKTVAPALTPLSRWPSKGRYPLVLMQQAAVNHAVAELADGGIVAINGPPGTGKTTLLRDVVAKVVLDRAMAMARFERPAQAFSHLTSMKVGQAYTHLYLLDQTLQGHEIVVASSNNGAVENISREIPAIGAVADDIAPPPRYFQSIADVLAAGKDTVIDGVTWGLAAAVLGNSTNRAAFVQGFWWHEQRGMARYFNAILCRDNPSSGLDTDGNIPEVVSLEGPPIGEIEALERWELARREFLAKFKRSQELQRFAQSGYQALVQKKDALQRVKRAAEEVTAMADDYARTSDDLAKAEAAHEAAVGSETAAREAAAAVRLVRPGFLARLFRTGSYRKWHPLMLQTVTAMADAQRKLTDVYQTKQQLLGRMQVSFTKLSRSKAEKEAADKALAETLGTLYSVENKIGGNFADDSFWCQQDSKLQTQSPWMFKEWQAARDALFQASFDLHRAFIDAAAKPLRHNLRAALELIRGRVLREPQEPARASLWASLFLVVPVISTTFASVNRLFGPLGREQLGWLLVDEAGQAVPQAVIGAIYRSKRALIIGDPMQIPPVVTIPPKLIRAVFSEYAASPEEWAAPEMSVQTIADRYSWFGTSIMTDDGDIWVGSPLRVHRRCEEAMYRISNHIAYNGLMVYGTPPGPSEVGNLIGPNRWFEVEGDATGKWSEAEGKLAVEILRKLLDAGMTEPDIYFITPFRVVAQKLREMIQREPAVARRLPGKPWEWTRDRVGTIHTFQGKEAEAVVIVLGAPLPESDGARRWAGHPPNILNVAVTRAKRRLYVIGNRKAWKDAGSFRYLHQMLE